jgi:hypothetical protein
MKKITIAVFGLGAVGSKLAYFLTKLGFTVIAFEESEHLHQNSGLATTNLSHNSGIEYCRLASKADLLSNPKISTHIRTAELCIDGSIANSLIYGCSSRISTGYIGHHANNPLQFLVAKGTLDKKNWNESHGFSKSDFDSNILYLRQFYSKRVDAIAKWKDCSILDAEQKLYGPPNLLGKKIESLEGINLDLIEFGVTDIGTSINQAYDYALWSTALIQAQAANLSVFLHQNLKSIKKTKDKTWKIETDSFQGEADFIFLTGSYGNPLLRSKIEESLPGTSGVFYLNAMVYAKLKATNNTKLQKVCNRGYFTLQHNFGGMGVSLIPLTSTQDGYVALYYPSMNPVGSQIKSLRYDLTTRGHEQNITAELCNWRNIIEEKLDNQSFDEYSTRIIEQATKLYPFYRDASIEFDRIDIRSVFNADTQYGLGNYRNIRVPTSGASVVKDGTIWELYGAKWTNSSLTALGGIDRILKFATGEGLPRDYTGFGLGLSSINVAACVEKLELHVKDVRPKLELAVDYVEKHKFPPLYIDRKHNFFD